MRRSSDRVWYAGQSTTPWCLRWASRRVLPLWERHPVVVLAALWLSVAIPLIRWWT